MVQVNGQDIVNNQKSEDMIFMSYELERNIPEGGNPAIQCNIALNQAGDNR